MSKAKIINIVVCVVAVAVVGVSAFAVGKHFQKNKPDISQTTAGNVYEVIGNADSEKEEDETAVEFVTDENGEPVTDENGEPITIVAGSQGTTGNQDTSDATTKKGSAGTTISKVYVTRKPSSGGSGKQTTLNQNSAVNNDNVSKQAGTLGFMWNSEDEVFYSASDPWQRKWGYNKIYDVAAPIFVMYFDTVRIKFNYGGLDWMIQCWKGQYGYVLLGAEVGVYYKEEGTSVEHYYCNDNANMLKVGFTCYNHGDFLFSRAYQNTWWLTGFVGGKLDRFSDRSQLTLKVRITLKDSKMTDAFVTALAGEGFSKGNASDPDTYYRSGNDVYFMWKTDRA